MWIQFTHQFYMDVQIQDMIMLIFMLAILLKSNQVQQILEVQQQVSLVMLINKKPNVEFIWMIILIERNHQLMKNQIAKVNLERIHLSFIQINFNIQINEVLRKQSKINREYYNVIFGDLLMDIQNSQNDSISKKDVSMRSVFGCTIRETNLFKTYLRKFIFQFLKLLKHLLLLLYLSSISYLFYISEEEKSLNR
ncbi:unnamed protein product [Paramecium sonneborni]|uniref:Transmembrane protein n=1 Tax=Paramecium sonneborni TaxID=65129 RepID=A0A8S1MS26_9CILI|nr:unnamed protein product [Paramecium sonneborni]